MTSQDIEDLLSQPNNAIIAVNRPTGGPQLTPVWYLWDGDSFYFSTAKDRAKYPNIKRNPSISLIVDDLVGHRYVTAYGKAQIIEQDFGEIAHRLISKYVPPDKLAQWANMSTDPNRVIVKLHPDKIVSR
jgi:PPOX class probable F420-dependent enzyme